MKFLVGVDGSPASAAALRWAAVLAKRLDARLVVAHVYSADASDPTSWSPAHDKRRHQLDGWCAPARAAGAEVTPVLLDGELGPALVAASEKEDVDLIVVSRRGEGGFEGLIVGSAADYIAHHAGRPIAVLPPDVASALPGHLLLGLDGSAGSAAAVAWTAPLARSVGAAVTAVLVEAPRELLSHLTSGHRADAEQRLADYAGPLEDAGVEVGRLVLEDRHPADAIIAAAEEAGADAVVVGTRSVGGFRRVRLGGVTMKLLHHCTQPVIAIPPPD